MSRRRSSIASIRRVKLRFRDSRSLNAVASFSFLACVAEVNGCAFDGTDVLSLLILWLGGLISGTQKMLASRIASSETDV
eukprot:5331219-Amphidinium_carterae.1